MKPITSDKYYYVEMEGPNKTPVGCNPIAHGISVDSHKNRVMWFDSLAQSSENLTIKGAQGSKKQFSVVDTADNTIRFRLIDKTIFNDKIRPLLQIEGVPDIQSDEEAQKYLEKIDNPYQ